MVTDWRSSSLTVKEIFPVDTRGSVGGSMLRIKVVCKGLFLRAQSEVHNLKPSIVFESNLLAIL